MKQTALKLLNLVYREHRLPVIGIDDEITIPLGRGKIFFTPLQPDRPGWYLGERTDNGFSLALHLDDNGNLFYTDEPFGDEGFDDWWFAIIKWCIDRLY